LAEIERQAAEELAHAAEALAGLGATSDAARCQRMLRKLGHASPSPPRGRRGYGGELSPREQQTALDLSSASPSSGLHSDQDQ
jgi:hypothetical protein